MRLTKDMKIAGLSATKVRDALRRYGGPNHQFTNEAIAEKCGVSTDIAAQVTTALEREGYITAAKHSDGLGWWETTSKGNALRLASTRTLKRSTAARMLGELLARAEFLNSNESEFAYRVKRIRVFGSYLTDVPVLGDLDTIIELEPREKDRERQQALERERVALAELKGRVFYDIQDLFFPYDEALSYLKNRTAGLSVHTEADAVASKAKSVEVFPKNELPKTRVPPKPKPKPACTG